MIALSLPIITLLFAVGVGAGLLGARIGIGGGVVLVPALVLGFGVDPKIAVATSLLAVIATSTAAGSVYVGQGLANTRLAIALEVATSLGGITGGLLAVMVPSRVLAGAFGLVMGVTALLMFRRASGRESGTLATGGIPARLASSAASSRAAITTSSEGGSSATAREGSRSGLRWRWLLVRSRDCSGSVAGS